MRQSRASLLIAYAPQTQPFSAVGGEHTLCPGTSYNFHYSGWVVNNTGNPTPLTWCGSPRSLARFSQNMKQAIVVRTDLEMSTGKLVAQACHASVAAVLRAPADILELWNLDGQTKTALQARSLAELIGLQQKCEALALVHALISDAGHTELATGTVTAPWQLDQPMTSLSIGFRARFLCFSESPAV